MRTAMYLADVSTLYVDTVHTTPQDRDWSEGYGEDWTPLEPVSCPDCGTDCRYIAGDELADAHAEGEGSPVWDRDFASESWSAWRCPNVACDRFGLETDPHEAGSEGPIMNYAYPLPTGYGDSYDESSAEKLSGLPLCIVAWEDGRYELALTGGGMDLSWEICEAFMRLGFLPPLHYCDLPAMAGKDVASERNAWIVAGCKRSCDVAIGQAQRTVDHLRDL